MQTPSEPTRTTVARDETHLRWFQSPKVVGGILFAAFVVPFLVTAVKLRHPKPYVVLDLAQTEMRVRDVFSNHPPLIGLPGRLGVFGVHVGSHPGPLSFYFLAPFYKLFGSTSWALFAGALIINAFWIGIALWLGWRRGGLRMLVGVGAVVLVLVHAFGIIVVEQPWNPYLPLMAWTVVLLSAWAVLAGDIAILPVMVAAASYCMQTHIPYLGMGGGLVGTTVLIALVFTAWRGRVDRSPSRFGWLLSDGSKLPGMRRVLIWVFGSVLLGALLWTPPVYEQIRWGSGGNLNLIWNDLAHPPQAAGGITQGIHLVLAHLNVVQLLTGHRIEFVVLNGNIVGSIQLAIWVIAAIWAWRCRLRLLTLLNLTLAIALVFAVAALSKIYGQLFWYLMMWMWTISAAMVASIVWTLIVVLSQLRLAERTNRVLIRTSQAVLGIVMAGCFLGIMVGASQAKIPDRSLSNQMAHVIPPTIRAINDGRIPGDTHHGRVLVNWLDPIKIGSGGYTLYDELNGNDIPAGMNMTFWGIIPRNEIIPPGQERGIVHLSVGDTDIKAWRARPHVVEVAYYDGRTPQEKAEFARLRLKARRLVQQAGGDPDVVDNSLTGASLNGAYPLAATQAMSRMSDIGLPVAVFLAPPGTS